MIIEIDNKPFVFGMEWESIFAAKPENAALARAKAAKSPYFWLSTDKQLAGIMPFVDRKTSKPLPL